MNTISINDVRKRHNSLNYKYQHQLNTNMELLTEQCKNTSSVRVMEEYVKHWEELNPNQDFAFLELLETLKIYMNGKASNSDKNKIINVVSEEVVPRIKNIKYAKKILQLEMSNEKIIEECDKNIACDRILNNHSKLNKKMDIDSFINEYNVNETNMRECVYEICENIDSYNMDFSIKLNVALENVLYGFNKNSIKYDKKEILESVTDYFLSKNLEDDQLPKMINILSESPMYCNEDKEIVNYIMEGSTKDNVKELLNKFKLEKVKTPEALKTIVRKIYTKSPDNILEETPNFLSWFRQFLVFSTLAINPYFGVITLFVDQFIKLSLQRKETDKMIEHFKKEKSKAETKMKNAKNEKHKENCKEYIKTLEKNIDTLEIYRDSLYSDKELDDMEKEKEEKDELDSLIESFMNQGNEEPIQEMTEDMKKQLAYILAMEMTVQELTDKEFEDVMSIVDQDIDLYDVDDYETLTQFSLVNSDIIKPEELMNIFTEYKQELYSKDSGLEKFKKGSSLQESIYELSKRRPIKNDKTNYEILSELLIALEVVSAIKDKQSLLETSFGNTIKMSQQRLKKSAMDLSDKEKMLSRQLDNSMDKMYMKIERELTNKNREAVIKGSILPSFSSILKIAVAAGVAALVNPAIAVIGVIGGLAVSKQATKKEKQFILDEIDIQLKMIEKKIQLAESNNDMKSLEQLLKIEQRLKRERQRILYNIKRYTPTPNVD